MTVPLSDDVACANADTVVNSANTVNNTSLLQRIQWPSGKTDVLADCVLLLA
ncbi:MAG: hypothetical protein HOP14_10235 [Acidobacteria bacterium]|nr:hypothetical protein [Acidobacteriota bacterium]